MTGLIFFRGQLFERGYQCYNLCMKTYQKGFTGLVAVIVIAIVIGISLYYGNTGTTSDSLTYQWFATSTPARLEGQKLQSQNVSTSTKKTIIRSSATTNKGFPVISLSKTSGPAGANIVIYLSATVPHMNASNKVRVNFKNTSDTASYIYDIPEGSKQIMYVVPDIINSGCTSVRESIPVNMSVGCDPYPAKVVPGTYEIYISMSEDGSKNQVQSNRVGFTVTQ